MNKVTITTFTDPMMGLSYECEPIFRKLETHFGENIHFKYNMCVLVKNVYDFVDPAYLEVSREFALENYNRRLAEIYKNRRRHNANADMYGRLSTFFNAPHFFLAAEFGVQGGSTYRRGLKKF